MYTTDIRYYRYKVSAIPIPILQVLHMCNLLHTCLLIKDGCSCVEVHVCHEKRNSRLLEENFITRRKIIMYSNSDLTVDIIIIACYIFFLNVEVYTGKKRTAKDNHIDPTSGHMGVKIVARIKERFAWKGIIRDVKQIVG